jgi:hypothetical protein
MLSAKIRSARSFGFKPGDLVKITIPEIRNFSGVVEFPEETHYGMLARQATKDEKYKWLERENIKFPKPAFFRQRHWMTIVEDEIIPVIEGFLTLEHRNTPDE